MGTIANAGNHVVTGEERVPQGQRHSTTCRGPKYPGANIVANVEHIKTGAVLHEDGTITSTASWARSAPPTPRAGFTTTTTS